MEIWTEGVYVNGKSYPETQDELVVPANAGGYKITLQYPFEYPYTMELAPKEEGYTVKDVIDEIRKGFRFMYTGTTEKPMKGTLLNMDVQSETFGGAYHDINDLVIEDLTIEGSMITPSIGS